MKNAKINFHPDKLPHIFRNAHGHVPDTPANRSRLLEMVNAPDTFQGFTRYGVACYARQESDFQLWAEVKDGTIRNCGMNLEPRLFQEGDGFVDIRRRL